MLSTHFQKSLATARDYFRDHLQTGDYYDSEKSTPGIWHGAGSDKLGLSGIVTEKDFISLCDGLNPATGESLTIKQLSERRIFYDFTFSAPKSVSIAGLVNDSPAVSQAHQNAVKTALAELERHASRRVRTNGESRDMTSGNVIAAVFDHDTARSSAEGIAPDPQLHSHTVIFNATESEGKWYALQNYDMLKAKKLVDRVYLQELRRELHKSGYQTRTTKSGFEIDGVSEKMIEQFSKRHTQIKELAAASHAGGNIKALEAKVATDHRMRKQPDSTATDLRANWQSQLTRKELNSLQNLGGKSVQVNVPTSEAVRFAIDNLFERNAVVDYNTLLSETVRAFDGADIQFNDVKKALENNPEIYFNSDKRLVTTRNALARESYIVDAVAKNKNKFKPLAKNYVVSDLLDNNQKSATQTVLASEDFFTVLRGGAGRGKSFTLKEIRKGMEKNGQRVVVLAPQNSQVQDLIKDGFSDAKTLASYLGTRSVPNNSVIIVDEAGQISGKDFSRLIKRAEDTGSRILASGDTRQHGAVEATDALIAIEKYAKPQTADLGTSLAGIRRQKDIWYKSAVSAAEKGDTVKSFELLEEKGRIFDLDNGDNGIVIENYLGSLEQGKSALVLSQTNFEVDQLNEKIQAKVSGNRAQTRIAVIKRTGWTEAEKMRSENYSDDIKLIATRGIGKIKKGDELSFVEASKNEIRLKDSSGEIHRFNAEKMQRVNPYKVTLKTFAKGDQIQLKDNVKIGKSKLANGKIFKYEGITENGNIVINDAGKSIQLPENFRAIDLGYATTSYASQGKTVDHVHILDSGSKLATSKKEYYVSVSRGKEDVMIYTNDKATLSENIKQLGNRPLAKDIYNDKYSRYQSSKNSVINRLQTQIRQVNLRSREIIKAVRVQIRSNQIRNIINEVLRNK